MVLYLLVEAVTGRVGRVVDQRWLAAAEYRRDLIEQAIVGAGVRRIRAVVHPR